MNKYTYSKSGDFPDGQINVGKFDAEIRQSNITVALNHVDVADDVVDIWFKAPLDSGNHYILDGGATGPASGLILLHDNSPHPEEVNPVTVTNNPSVVPTKPSPAQFSRIYSFSVNICDPTTWYIDSAYASGVTLLDPAGVSGLPINPASGKTYLFPNNVETGESIIDLCHGKITEENALVAPTGTYLVEVFADGVKMQERECYEDSGGDYRVYYEAGLVEFFESQEGKTITGNYYYTPSGVGPIFSVKPPPGKKWIIDAAELQVSRDFEMTDTIVQNVFITHPTYGRIKVVQDVEYKHFSNFLDFTYGSYPVIPKVGTGPRAMIHDTIIMRWEYLAPLELLSSMEAELRSWAKHGRKFDGERFTLAVYGLETDE